MQKVNYQKKLDELIGQLEKKGKVPSLLLHSCCAPCSSYCLEYLSQYFKITVFYYNPNIFPKEEYEYRIQEQQRLIDNLPSKHPISFCAKEYEPEKFYERAKGYEGEMEGGERCNRCFRLRLEETAKLAKTLKMDYYTTTLTISPLKNAQNLNEIGMELGELYQVDYLESDFKKRGGYKRSVELSKEYELYRQDYCGCVYSKQETEERREKFSGNI